MKQQTKTELTKELAEDIASAIHDGLSGEQIYAALNISANSFWYWIGQSALAPERSPELEIIRSAILDVLLKDSVIAKAMKSIETPKEKRSVKVTRILNLSETERLALKKEGYADFVKEHQTSPITLKVEETREMIPPNDKVLELLIRHVANSITPEDLTRQITTAADIHPELEESI